MQKLFLILFLNLSVITTAIAQQSISDSSIFIPSLGINYTYQFVGGDLATTFGNNSAIGADATFKLKNNWVIGTSFQYYFSDQVKNKEAYFKDIQTSSGFIIDGNGQFAEVFLYQRGFNAQIFGGYQFDFWSPNPNSGPFIQLSVGMMRYWVRIENPDMVAPQVKGDYKKMYDRLSGGISTTEFIGYRWMGARNLANFYAGIEFTQGFTENKRNYNADLDPADIGKHLDILTGIKVGWIIPFYPKAPKEFYYY